MKKLLKLYYTVNTTENDVQYITVENQTIAIATQNKFAVRMRMMLSIMLVHPIKRRRVFEISSNISWNKVSNIMKLIASVAGVIELITEGNHTQTWIL